MTINTLVIVVGSIGIISGLMFIIGKWLRKERELIKEHRKVEREIAAYREEIKQMQIGLMRRGDSPSRHRSGGRPGFRGGIRRDNRQWGTDPPPRHNIDEAKPDEVFAEKPKPEPKEPKNLYSRKLRIRRKE